ncbi:type II secretion system protein [Candidatus Saccharibacteria bacterium]|nr:type II secretion system protein [Candidatus Saccharibacteria bacterium]
MKQENIKRTRGFTIIEVVLVLAIAGLIFLMVFVALPNMQRSQRDSQRRQDYASLVANMIQFMTNNGGKMPTVRDGGYWDFYTKAKSFVNTSGEDPSGNSYVLVLFNARNFLHYSTSAGAELSNTSRKIHVPPKEPGEIAVIVGARCGDESIDTASGSKLFAVVGYMESSDWYCVDNGD